MYDEFLITDGAESRIGGGCQPLERGGSASAGAGTRDGKAWYEYTVTGQDDGVRIILSGNGKNLDAAFTKKQLESPERRTVELQLNDSTKVRLAIWGVTSCKNTTVDADTADGGS